MPSARTTLPAHASPADTTQAVDDFMARLEHPFKPGIETIRAIMLGVDPSVSEGIKWNAPSFRTSEYFATVNLRAKSGVDIILHLGAKVRALPAGGITIPDPGQLLRWLGKDRASISFGSTEDLLHKQAALHALLREWIGYV